MSHIADHLHYIGLGLDLYSSKYDKFYFFGDINNKISITFMEQFCGLYHLKVTSESAYGLK